MKPIFQLETPVLMPILSPTSFTHSADRLSFKIDQKLSSTKKDYLENLPLFCRMEELIFKQSGLNLRINLGSNDQVRKLEGKF
ncbi:MAG TPA: hypothetical protein PLY70_11430 [Saprospiraceae bacterium]|nr:hypothetical protein [Saprospiraceae bacterium]HPN69838.1 hypothetical protein [Saprospiraceae bacterium]